MVRTQSALMVLVVGAAGCRSEATTAQPEAGPSLVSVTGDELMAVVRQPGPELTVLNVWATWCGPCIEEFPHIQRVARSYHADSVRLVFVSTDFDAEREAALRFLRQQGAELPSYIKSGRDQAFTDALAEDWSGSIPVTFIFDADGNRLEFFKGKVEADVLKAALDRHLRKAG